MYNLDFIYKYSAYNPVTRSSAEVYDLTPHAQDKDSTRSYWNKYCIQAYFRPLFGGFFAPFQTSKLCYCVWNLLRHGSVMFKYNKNNFHQVLYLLRHWQWGPKQGRISPVYSHPFSIFLPCLIISSHGTHTPIYTHIIPLFTCKP